MRATVGQQDVVPSTSSRSTSKTKGTMISLWNVLLSISVLHFSNAAASSSRTGSAATTPSTCPSRTINYITHGLPQQCLATNRAGLVNGTGSTSSLGSNATTSRTQNASTNAVHTTSLVSVAPGLSDQTIAAGSPSWPSPVTLDRNVETHIEPPDVPSSMSSTTVASPTASSTAADDSEADSLLDNANFLSFEDWKKQNLLKAGQSELVGAGRQNEHRDTGKRSNPALQQGLDALGDDAEIDLDFTGFVADRPDLAPPKQPVRVAPEDSGLEPEQEPAVLNRPRSKDAGTTCKERYNFASFDCAATVLKTNTKAKGEKYVLLENKDSYMLNECSADNKFLILELCNDISIDTIVLANFEFFSSIFRTFRVSVSDKYPVKTEKWITLGTFEARNSREIQAFLVENPMIWARYVRIEFLTHYGNEFYCPLSLVRVHGTTMMEEYKHDIQSALLEEDGDDNEMQSTRDLEPEESLVPEAVAQVLVDERSRFEEAQRALPTPEPSKATGSPSMKESMPEPELGVAVEHSSNATSPNNHLENLFMSSSGFCSTTSITKVASSSPSVNEPVTSLATDIVAKTQTSPSGPASITKSDTMASFSVETKNAMSSDKVSVSPVATLNSTSSLAPDNTHSSIKANNSTASEKSKVSISSTQPQPASPTIQESFFKSVQKRLQMLESNSSLSLQYIEEQSRALRDAFGRVEQKQLSKTTTFLDYLNATVLNELRDFRQQYDQLWQSTVIELETQREQYQQEALAINSRLAILADELIFQKRMSMLQMVLVLLCLGLVLFSRGPMNNYMDIPIVQSMLARSPSNKWMSMSNLQTPSTSPPQTRPSSSHNARPVHGVLKRHSRERSDDSMNSVIHNTEEYSPLTPISNDGQFDVEDHIEHPQLESPSFDPSEIERPSTSPPVLPSSEGNATPDFVALRDETIDSRLLRDSKTDINDGNAELPELTLRPATPPVRHLTFQLPER